jgi:hypothetical protein
VASATGRDEQKSEKKGRNQSGSCASSGNIEQGGTREAGLAQALTRDVRKAPIKRNPFGSCFVTFFLIGLGLGRASRRTRRSWRFSRRILCLRLAMASLLSDPVQRPSIDVSTVCCLREPFLYSPLVDMPTHNYHCARVDGVLHWFSMPACPRSKPSPTWCREELHCTRHRKLSSIPFIIRA